MRRLATVQRDLRQDRLMRPLEPLTEARAGGLVVRGYAGAQEQYHVMHLVQMSVTGLPDLVQHWSGSAKR